MAAADSAKAPKIWARGAPYPALRNRDVPHAFKIWIAGVFADLAPFSAYVLNAVLATFSAVAGTSPFKSLAAATQTWAGGMARQTRKPLAAAAATMAASRAVLVGRALLANTATLGASLVRRSSKVLAASAGALGAALGALCGKGIVLLAGMATMAAASFRGVSHVLDASMDPGSRRFTVLRRMTLKNVCASVEIAGSLVRGVARWISAVLANLAGGFAKTSRAARPAGIYLVLKESRLFAILREVRGFVVTNEPRGLNVEKESRRFAVAKEDRHVDVKSD